LNFGFFTEKAQIASFRPLEQVLHVPEEGRVAGHLARISLRVGVEGIQVVGDPLEHPPEALKGPKRSYLGVFGEVPLVRSSLERLR
jgi:hypothetical protein